MPIPDLIALNRHDSPAWPEAEREPWAQAKHQFHPRPHADDRLDAALGERLLRQITCPTLLITADLDRGALFPPAAAAALAAELPQASHVNLPGAGHNIRRERPAAFVEAMRDFLAGLRRRHSRI